MNGILTTELLAAYDKRFSSDRANRAAMTAVINNGVNETAKNYEAVKNTTHEFSLSLEQGKITNQKSSGRCWMFAAMNFLRYHIIHNLNLEDFELSQNYPLFFDKLEKANYFLESILETLEEPVEGRLMAHLLSSPMGDGGQWDMICSLIEKYGVVPKAAMPETAVSSMTRDMNAYLTEKLRGFACSLRKGHESGRNLDELREEKKMMLESIYDMLCICLGKPPKAFDFEVTGKDGVFHRERGLTPKEFYNKYVGINLGDYISVINAPTGDKPFHRSYSVKFLGNVKEGRQVRYVNVEIEVMKEAAVAQMKDKIPVWFGCDVGKRSSREDGIMDLTMYSLEDIFGTDFPMTKGERLTYGQSLMTHAMVFVGVNLDEDGKPDRWRVENSWGEDRGRKGFFVMTDEWFDEYMYQIVVNKKYLPKEVVEEYESEPVMLEPWDPMGSLAL